MTGKERIFQALAGGRPEPVPIALDYLFLYLAERIEQAYVSAYRERLLRHQQVRLDPDEDAWIRAQAILQAYTCFSERDDWLYAPACPAPEVLRQRALALEGDKVYLVDLQDGSRQELLLPAQQSKTEYYRDYYARQYERARRRTDIQSLLKEYITDVRAQRMNMAVARHLIASQGQDYFIYTGLSGPFWALFELFGFEGMMTACYDFPSEARNIMDTALELALERAGRFRDAGGHGIRIEECLVSADLISPTLYEEFVFPYEEKLCAGLRRMGLKVLLYFCGDVMPRLPALTQLPIDALMVEESKKGFRIDIGEVRAAVGNRLCLFGNIDTYEVMRMGTPAQIRQEAERQLRAAGAHGAFIMGIGSPLPLDTPAEHVDVLIEHTRRCAWPADNISHEA